MRKKIIGLLTLTILSSWATTSNAALIYKFSFDNVIGTTEGTVEGLITLDFLSSASDSGSGMASQIQITSAPASLPLFVQGDILTDWATQSLNTFTVVSGVITDYQFGATEGAPSVFTDNVFCLNSGAQFDIDFVSDGGIYICGANENYLGDAYECVYNIGGIQAVTFGPVSVVHAPATLALFGLGFAGLVWSRRKKA